MKICWSDILKAIGPGFIMASVVLGPGSITTSSKIGAEHGNALLWVIVLAAVAAATFTLMSARFGATQTDSILHGIAIAYGRWFAALIGISCFLMAASFQFGNNLGVATALKALTGISENVWPFVFNGLAIILVFFAKNLYKVLEKLMMGLVMIMIVAFFVNLIFTRPDLISIGKGFVPSVPSGSLNEMAALVATTFCLHVCLYQSYLVQDKCWECGDLKKCNRDTLSGIVMLSGISMLIIMTSASALFPRGIHITSAADMAIQLEALFGSSARIIFSLGLWAAAFSSLTVNAIVGGGLLSDGLGLGRSMQSRAPKLFTVLIMLVGMTIAVFFKGNIVHALVLAQASSLFAVPSVAIGLFLMLNNKKTMGSWANNRRQNVLAVFGLILIGIMVYTMYFRLVGFIGRL